MMINCYKCNAGIDSVLNDNGAEESENTIYVCVDCAEASKMPYAFNTDILGSRGYSKSYFPKDKERGYSKSYFPKDKERAA